MTGQSSKDSSSLLDQARTEHIRDLRVLLDQSVEREKEFAGMLKLVMEERFYRPVITRPGENKTTPILPPDQLQDVTAFDQAADQAQIEDHEELGRNLQQEFEELKREEDEYRAQKA